MVYSNVLEETVFFCQDEQTRAALQEAGADPWSIYTRTELQTLVEQNRIAPLTRPELAKLHEIKRTFNARITPKDSPPDLPLERDVAQAKAEAQEAQPKAQEELKQL